MTDNEKIVSRPIEQPMAVQDRCVTALVDDHGAFIGIVKEGDRGYYPTDWRFKTYADAEAYAKEFNEKLGVTEKQAIEMVLRSMRKDKAGDEEDFEKKHCADPDLDFCHACENYTDCFGEDDEGAKKGDN